MRGKRGLSRLEASTEEGFDTVSKSGCPITKFAILSPPFILVATSTALSNLSTLSVLLLKLSFSFNIESDFFTDNKFRLQPKTISWWYHKTRLLVDNRWYCQVMLLGKFYRSIHSHQYDWPSHSVRWHWTTELRQNDSDLMPTTTHHHFRNCNRRVARSNYQLIWIVCQISWNRLTAVVPTIRISTIKIIIWGGWRCSRCRILPAF